jgi:peptide/nickel transport system ATP-binding protein
MPVLSIKELSLGFNRESPIVKKVSLEIEEGEIHGLIGESGSGKSLTAMSVMKLLPPRLDVLNGSITLDLDGSNNLIAKISDRELRELRGNKVGFIFQDPMTSLNPSIKCGKQVAEVLTEHGIFPRKEVKKEVIRLFRKVKLPDPEKIFNAYPHEISGGQRQRVMIAMSVACKPKLLIADEPTTALDVTVQKSIIELLDELRKSEGLAVLFISHDLGLIASYADRISIMYKGEIVESDINEKIINHPLHPYTKGLLACKPPIDKKVNRLKTLEEIMSGESAVEEVDTIESETRKKDVILEVKGLNTFYTLKRNLFGKVTSEMHALKNISFELKKNESLGLVGESGSGKSTLGRSLLKLIESRSGEVYFDGESLLDMPKRKFKKLRERIQFIFQDPYASLNPKMTIGEAITEPLKVHGIGLNNKDRKEKVLDLLKKVGLSESDYIKYPHQFSGGQRQRIVIARALTVEPEFIVCDEAVSALDVSVQARILNLLKDLQEEFNLTFLFITHDMAVVRFFCDRLIVMKDGEIVESGETEDVFNKPAHAFTQELINASF